MSNLITLSENEKKHVSGVPSHIVTFSAVMDNEKQMIKTKIAKLKCIFSIQTNKDFLKKSTIIQTDFFSLKKRNFSIIRNWFIFYLIQQ